MIRRLLLVALGVMLVAGMACQLAAWVIEQDGEMPQ